MNPQLSFAPPLRRGTLLRRYKRFLADVEVNSAQITMHCANTGAMLGCSKPGSSVWYSTHTAPGRKYVHSLELVEVGEDLVCVNTHRANQLMKLALGAGLVQELANPTLSYRSEVPVLSGRGRFDFGNADTHIEIKSVTLCRAGIGSFPDARTRRGERHMFDLSDSADAGLRAVLVFLAMHTGVASVCLADEIDPDYAASVRRAMAHGVEVLAYACKCGVEGLSLGARLPFSALS